MPPADPTNLAAIYRPTLRERIQLRLGFRRSPWIEYEDRLWAKDIIYTEVRFQVSWRDMLLLLVSRKIAVRTVTHVEVPPGMLRTASAMSVCPPGADRR